MVALEPSEIRFIIFQALKPNFEFQDFYETKCGKYLIKRLAGNEDEIYESLANVPSLVNFIPEVVSSCSMTYAYVKYLIKTTFSDIDQYLFLKILKVRHALVKIFKYLIHICGIKLPIFSTLALELLIASLTSD